MTRKLSLLLKRIVRQHSLSLRRRGQVISALSNKIGLVHFGTVDQKEDEHDVIRGLTVSTTHQDSHYAVGAYDGRDISIVDRFDVITDAKGRTAEHNWVIMQINLSGARPLPHMFFKPLQHSHTSYDKFFVAFHHLQSVNALLLQSHGAEFHNRYQLFASSSRTQEIEESITETTTNTIAARFWPHAIEILDNKLYVYTTDAHLTKTLLESALQSALWLANELDPIDQN